MSAAVLIENGVAEDIGFPTEYGEAELPVVANIDMRRTVHYGDELAHNLAGASHSVAFNRVSLKIRF